MQLSILDQFRKPTQSRLIQLIEESIQLEKIKLLEAKQAKDFADTDIAYREKRIASLLQSLKEEKNEKANYSDARVPRDLIAKSSTPAFVTSGIN